MFQPAVLAIFEDHQRKFELAKIEIANPGCDLLGRVEVRRAAMIGVGRSASPTPSRSADRSYSNCSVKEQPPCPQ